MPKGSATTSKPATWTPPVIPMPRAWHTGKATRTSRTRPTVLQVATMNKAIGSTMGYGPIETVIFNVDKGLRALGYRSIVACSADSEVTGEKCETVPTTLGDYASAGSSEAQAHIDLHLSRALMRAGRGDVDVVHMHEWFERVCLGTFNPRTPVVMTLHVPGAHSGVAEFRALNPLTLLSPSLHFVAISEFQRRQYTGVLPVSETIHHGVDVDDYSAVEEPNAGAYLLCIGRMTAVKGQDTAIAVARRTGSTLVLAGCVQNKSEDREFFSRLGESIDLVADVSRIPVGPSYYDEVMRPILSSGKKIIYVGELGGAAKRLWYRHARATLFPVRWGEPFGMVLIESMASGTPVVALREGAVAEIVKHDETGFVVDSPEAMVAAIGHLDRIDRSACRAHVAARFSVRSMAAAYASLYERLVTTSARTATHFAARQAETAARPAVALR